MGYYFVNILRHSFRCFNGCWMVDVSDHVVGIEMSVSEDR